MPLYEYRCAGCGARFDLFRSFSQADAPATCPECRGDDTQRAISRVAAFSRGSDGASAPVAGGGGCAGCSSGHCASCHH